MDPAAPLRGLHAWNAWANRTLRDALAAVPVPPPKAVRLLGHLVGCNELWLTRLRCEPPPEVWPTLALDACAARLEALVPAWDAQLDADAARLAAPVAYVNSQGVAWTSTVQDVLLHVPLHDAHHRGQVAQLLVQAGYAVPSVDYVHAVRTGAIGAAART